MRYIGLLAAAAVIAVAVYLSPIAPPQFIHVQYPKADREHPVKPVVISRDLGGLLQSYVVFFSELARSGVPVQIAGECISGCTIIFSLPKGQVCAWREAVLGFHGARSVDDMKHVNEEMTKKFAEEFYPEPVRTWFLENAANSVDITYRPATDFFPVCA